MRCFFIFSSVFDTAPPFFLRICSKNRTKCSPLFSATYQFSSLKLTKGSSSDPDHARIYTVPSTVLPKMFKKQDGMLAFFWYCACVFLTQHVQKTRRNARRFYLKNVNFRVKHLHVFSLFEVWGCLWEPSSKKVPKTLPKSSEF